jgi:putative Mg2+ transporter-C (MgtC) family protein
VELLQVALGDLHRVVQSPWCEAISVLMAFVCGAIVGVEREKGHKPAGLRTQILICIGSAVFTIISMSPAMGGHEPARIAAQIVTGVGFLGAGSILRDRGQITGLTTAATIWTVSAIGIVVGAGYVTAGVMTSLGVLFVLGIFRQAETVLGGRCTSVSTVVIYRPESGKTRALIIAALDDAHGRLHLADEKERAGGLSEMRIEHCNHHRDHRAFLAVLAAMPNVEALENAPPPAPSPTAI